MDAQLNIHTLGEALPVPFAQPPLPALIEQTARQVYEAFSEKLKATLNGRQERALKLALEGHVTHKSERIFSVRSENGQHAYLVDLTRSYCNCPDSQAGHVCKHRLAAYLVEQADKAAHETVPIQSEPQPEQADPAPPDPDVDVLDKVRLALHARSEFLRESIIFALLEVDDRIIPVEVLEIDGNAALVRALPAYKDGTLTPQFPFPEKKSFAQVIAQSLREVKIYR